MPIASDNSCPNCGNHDFDHKQKGYECRKCGFHKVEAKELDEVTLIFCEMCGCTLSRPCNIHDADKQRPVRY